MEGVLWYCLFRVLFVGANCQGRILRIHSVGGSGDDATGRGRRPWLGPRILENGDMEQLMNGRTSEATQIATTASASEHRAKHSRERLRQGYVAMPTEFF